MTFSLAGRCARTGAMGGVVCSSSIAVPSRCLWGSAQGVVLSQNVTDPRLGVLGIQLLKQGFGAGSVVTQMVAARANAQWRQLASIDTDGETAVFTGENGLGTTATVMGRDCVAAGNLLANEEVIAAMVKAFEARADAFLAERLLAALEAGADAGGEAGPVHSAGFCVFDNDVWPVAELRVDWSETPIADLRALWLRYAPQMNDYATRARNPEAAPSYGVPGDL
ncbi:DUF1028 domain-containing protein [Paraburkholderia caballeronis]|uniref:Uncharacterized conserved protein, Ntn-hydrolase superfamily n=1 Tax=Paraburkholderia caballeronis TaxID=416943 RepID=A0A1H7QJK0_9BURK|nr:DUF1028 domain-containing protein [Paraburkholderia caballeronis]PXW22529.1 putative Ntn-hydrolase superfamily protein [Paraburkholderia caballeronis]PXW96400.1 putative Ntn-hydrolase superfamily protein [Paraburkholderia caballeronis]RAJ92811.1 putative Ntn-hydrolase superfamily protein [Paraburkholderia caballeronis]TDV15029.1 putative Ntn-hydrolase superfamily protein [Paraburkholderia caballeronis]TDV16846.1 putative Ntn-hydrolase superfamily protein [Paraburkholderia caballeronis]